MSDVTTAAEAVKKLNMLTGGMRFWLSSDEQQLITNLTGQVSMASSVVSAGPGDSVSAEYSFPYELNSGQGFGLTVSLDGDTKIFTASAGSKGEMATSVLSRLISSIQKEFGSGIEVTSRQGATIASTIVVVTSNTDKEITLTNAVAA